MDKNLLTIKNLSKYFKKFCALDNISLTIENQQIFGLLGINGAGKTTLIKSIFGLLKKQSGSIQYKNNEIKLSDIHSEFGYLPESFSPPKELKGKEFLKLLGSHLNIDKKTILSLFEKVGLDPNKKISAYSRGMIQRLGLATALLKDPKVLILDEPTGGLDPLGQNTILKLIKDLNENGKTIFFSSHNLSHVHSVCTKIAIIDQGKVKFEGSINQIIENHNAQNLEEAFLNEIDEKNIAHSSS